jgi:hypothetical protein
MILAMASSYLGLHAATDIHATASAATMLRSATCVRGLSSLASRLEDCPTRCALLVRLRPWAPSTSTRMRGI